MSFHRVIRGIHYATGEKNNASLPPKFTPERFKGRSGWEGNLIFSSSGEVFFIADKILCYASREKNKVSSPAHYVGDKFG